MFKKLLLFILPVFFSISAALYFFPAKITFAKTNPTENSVQSTKKVIVYYFYGKPRCDTCKKIEQYTRESIEDNFSDEIKSGKLSFQTINLDKQENKHFLKDYKLYTKAVIVSEIKNGKEIKFKNLDKIWTITNNEKKFKDYIKKEVKTSLGN